MFTIDFKDKDFIILIEEYLERDEFMIIVNFFKRIFIQYVNGDWTIPFKRIDEILMWLDKYKYVYKLSDVAKIKFQEFRKSFRQETTFNRHIEFDSSVLKNNIKLYEFQKEGIIWLSKRNRSFLADDAGLGKTLQSIAIFSFLIKTNKIDSIFICVRNGLSYNWLYEILDFSSMFKEEEIFIINNETKIQPFKILQDKKIIICPNHLIADVFASYKKDYTRSKKLSTLKWSKPFVNIKEEWNKNSICLIVDEAHELKNSKALRSKAMSSHKTFFDYRFLLSATPAINDFTDWWHQLNLLDESIIPLSENAFKIDVSKSIGNNYGIYNINEYDHKKVDYYRQKFSTYVLRRLKKDLPEMKAKQTIEPIYLPLEGLHQQLYQNFIQHEITKLTEEHDRITYKLIMMKFPYLVMMLENPMLLDGKIITEKITKLLEKWKPENDPRVRYLDEALSIYIKDNNEKIVVFDNHPRTLDTLYKRYLKYEPLIMHGGTHDNEKTKNEKQNIFNDKNSKHKLFLLNPQVGGAGINLNVACKREIFYTLPNDALLTSQALDRIYRINNTEDVIIEILLIAKSLDIIRYNRTINRIEFNNAVLNQSISEEQLKNLVNGII